MIIDELSKIYFDMYFFSVIYIFTINFCLEIEMTTGREEYLSFYVDANMFNQTKNHEIAMAVTNVGLKFFLRGKVYFFTSNHGAAEDMLTSAILQGLMAPNVWATTVTSNRLELPAENLQEKKPKEPNVVILLHHEEDWSDVLSIFGQLRLLGPKSRILLVVPSEPSPFLRSAWERLHVLNMTTLTYFSNNVSYHTFFPYEMPPRVESLGAADNLFPHKIPEDFKGYPLRVVAEPMDPYVLTHADNGRKDGIEIRMVETILGYYNINASYLVLSRADQSRVNYRGGKANGLFRVVSHHETDIAMSGLRTNTPRYELSEPLYSHTEDRLVWSYPRAEPEHDWRSLYQAFSPITWGLVASLTLIIAAVATLLEVYSPRSDDRRVAASFSRQLLYNWGMILEMASPVVPKTLLRRGFMAITFMYTVNLACSYKSTLVTLLTAVKPGRTFETVVEAAETGLKVYIQRMPLPTDPDIAFWNSLLIPGRFGQSYNSTIGLEAAANGSGVALSVEYPSRFIVAKHFLDNLGKPLITYMKNPQSIFPVTFFMAPGHPLEERFNRKTIQLIEGGITHVIRETIMFETLLEATIAKGVSDSSSSLPKVLTLGNLFAIFVILGISLAISSVIFCGELIYFRWHQRRMGKIDEGPIRGQEVYRKQRCQLSVILARVGTNHLLHQVFEH